jgi:HK97 gp10 family phage protein
MAKISVDVELKTKLPEAARGLAGEVDSLQRRIAHRILEISETIVPVATGELRDSGDIEHDGEGYNVMYTAPHSIYVHNGTRRMPARPFLTQAVNRADPEFQQEVADLEDFLARYAV